MITPGGHPIDFSQPAIPVQHRKYGNPIPIGLIAFSMAFMMVGLLSVGVRGIKAPNGVLSSLSESALSLLGVQPLTSVFFVGITQTLVGWFEMFIGNTFS
jgi:succinate-acetate transporter protein